MTDASKMAKPNGSAKKPATTAASPQKKAKATSFTMTSKKTTAKKKTVAPKVTLHTESIETVGGASVDVSREVIEDPKTVVVDVAAASIDLPAAPATSDIPVIATEPVRASDGVPVTTGEVQVSTATPSRRERMSGDFASPEPVSMLTPNRVLDETKQRRREAPEAGFNRFLYFATATLVNRGDSAKVRHRKALDAAISARIDGRTRFVPVLTRKGGVGKTTITTLLGMALARTREDRIVAIDANPDRGTLAERFKRTTDYTVRDIVDKAGRIQSFNDFSEFVSRDKTRLDVLASDTDPLISEAFDERDYAIIASLVSQYYTIALTDCGTGIVHSVMKATLQLADDLVIVSGGSFDEARLAAETLTWLESNGYAHLVRNAVVALNTATPGTNLVKIDEIEAHFSSRVRAIVRFPYDPALAAGSFIDFDKLSPATREAARQLAALVVEGVAQK